MLPTFGLGLALFLLLSCIFERINRIALFASVIVLNPVVKWGVYAASVGLGFLLLGPVDGGVSGDLTTDAGVDVLLRLIVGNVILALIGTVIAYLAMLRFMVRYQSQAREVMEAVIEEVDDERIPDQSSDK